MGKKPDKKETFNIFGAEEPDGYGEIISILPDDTGPALPEDGDSPRELPILSLRNTVFFPNTVIPITISRGKSISLINAAEKNKGRIGVVAQKSADTEDPEESDIFQIGTVANIIKKIKLPDQNTMVILQGIQKFRLNKIIATEPFMTAEVLMLQQKEVVFTKKVNGMLETMRELAEKIIDLSPHIPKEAAIALQNIDSPYFLANFIASNLNIDVVDKQKLLEISDFGKLVETILVHLNREVEMLQIKSEIQSKVRVDMDKQQRDFFLQQQLKTIHEELGMNTPDKEIEEFKKRASKKKWSKQVAEVFNKEIAKLSRMNPAAADYSVVANYIELLLDLPWNEYTKDNLDLSKAQKILDEDHYGLEKIKERILEYLSVIKLKGDMKSPILCLAGPPGVGKTSLGKSIARAMGRKYIRMSLGGLHDEAEIRGHRKTYIGAMPGRIVQSIKKAKSSNPVIVLDEIDKVGRDYKGDPTSALLEVLDPEQNSTFYDNYLEMEYDLSHVMFVATANTLETLQPALRDRLEIIDLSGYLIEEKIQIAKKFLVPKQRKMHGLKGNYFRLSEKAINIIIEDFTRESGVRALEKKIAKLCRWQAKSLLSDPEFKATFDQDKISEVLGPKIFERETYKMNHQPGVARGLAWTAVGGDVLYIEATLSPGKGNINLTGKLGEVMKESAMLAFTYLKSNYSVFGINPKALGYWDVHLHVPEGAVPKEGPSAGITILTTLVSLFTQKPVREDVAMTGELTLKGNVLPVGGIKEKILAAKRQGVKNIILCKNNEKDVLDINTRYLEGLHFFYVKNALEVTELALHKKAISQALNVNNPEFADNKE